MNERITLQRLANFGAIAVNETFVPRVEWVHDWQRYISDDLQKIWTELSDEARGVAIYVAQEVADAEEWD